MTAVRGMTLIEAVVGTAIMLVVFLGIFAAFQISIDLIFSTRAATSATALVNERMEYVRGLTYDAIGTQGGIPAGPIPQVEQITANGVNYTVATLVQYVDDPTDGLDEADETGVTADYKVVRVSANWSVRGRPRTTFAVTRISPTGIETLADGGTIRVNVFDTAAEPVSGATVRIVNTDVNPDIDVSVTTGVSGSVAFPGAPPASNYEVTVTKSGYSSAQTYPVTVENQNPNPGHISVVDETTTTLSLSIDETGSLKVYTYSPIGDGEFEDLFSDDAKLSATTSAEVSAGALVLSGGAGSYASTGDGYSISIAPNQLVAWDTVSWSAVTPTDTAALVSLYYWDGAAYSLIPDADIPGNAAGLSSGTLDISALPIATYGTLRLRAALSSSDVNVTPEIRDWNISYSAGPTPLADVEFDIRGAKTIGVSSQGAPLYKYDESHTTTQYGEWIITPIDPDSYTISLPSGSPHTISELCAASPVVSPAGNTEVSMTVVDAVTNSLRAVVTGNGSPLSGATVSISGGAVSDSDTTSSCGQVFFGGIPVNSYTVTISAPGFQDSIETISVTGSTVLSVALTPS